MRPDPVPAVYEQVEWLRCSLGVDLWASSDPDDMLEHIVHELCHYVTIGGDLGTVVGLENGLSEWIGRRDPTPANEIETLQCERVTMALIGRPVRRSRLLVMADEGLMWVGFHPDILLPKARHVLIGRRLAAFVRWALAC